MIQINCHLHDENYNLVSIKLRLLDNTDISPWFNMYVLRFMMMRGEGPLEPTIHFGI